MAVYCLIYLIDLNESKVENWTSVVETASGWVYFLSKWSSHGPAGGDDTLGESHWKGPRDQFLVLFLYPQRNVSLSIIWVLLLHTAVHFKPVVTVIQSLRELRKMSWGQGEICRSARNTVSNKALYWWPVFDFLSLLSARVAIWIM